MEERHQNHVAVVVMGDLGRSPRMQYHALSLLEHGFTVSLVGYTGENLIPELQTTQQESVGPTGRNSTLQKSSLNVIRFRPYHPPSFLRRGILKPIYLFLRAISLAWGIVYALWCRIPRDIHARSRTKLIPINCILVQNPPSIPLLLIAYLYCKMRCYIYGQHVGLIIDWHNLGFTMFHIKPTHPIRRIAFMYERFMAPRADGHLCVTRAMKNWIVQNFHVSASNDSIQVLYDRPPDFFQPTDVEAKHNLMKRLNTEIIEQHPNLNERFSISDQVQGSYTLLTRSSTDAKCDSVRIVNREDRPKVLVSSTSWTPDEDFGILLDALVNLDSMIETRSQSISTTFRHLLVIVTGKGPLCSMYKAKIAQLPLKYISIHTLWLEASDYPLLLGSADLGVSLHSSTSGIDLPMKILDMFGCHVPVCALRYECLNELVDDNNNGRTFSSSSELCQLLFDLLISNHQNNTLELYRANIREMKRWRENWHDHALKTILSACQGTQGYSITSKLD